MRTAIVVGIAATLLATSAAWWAHDMQQMHPQDTGQAARPAAAVPDVPVLDQDGKRLKFYSDLMRGRTVAIDFMYTSCTTFCPLLSANFRTVQEDLRTRIGRDIDLISISVDPVTDTPEKLKAFAAQFDVQPGWTFVTGRTPDIANLLASLGQPLGTPDDHTPLVLVRNDKVGGWIHVDGNDPAAVRDALIAAAGPARASISDAAEPARARGSARAYMQNPLLLTQDDKPVHFFDDLLRGKIVLINFMLTTCADICPMVTPNLARVQDLLGDKMGRSIYMISLSVDPSHDQPAALRKFADNFGVKPGWYFLTGASSEIDPLLRRLGAYTTDPLDHSTTLIVGNVDAGIWTKMFAMADPADIARAVLALQSPATK